jgi:two-component system aerobic respiration control protein ArcA
MKKLNTNELIQKIEKLTKERMASDSVVSLDKYRALKHKLEPKTLLIIEDDESMQAALTRMLEPEGYILRMAKDATELTNLLDDNPVDLILLDIGLPWINGFEIAEMLKQHRELKKIPLVFVSGISKDEDIKKAFEIGADDFLKKPFDVEKLRKTIKVLLKINKEQP